MKRNPRKVKWTKAYRKLAGKELAEDSTFEMERRRNRPEVYDRETVHKTLQAIPRVEKVRVARQARLHAQRMKKGKADQKLADAKELEQDITLVRAPASLLKQAQEPEKLRIPVEQAQTAEDMQQ